MNFLPPLQLHPQQCANKCCMTKWAEGNYQRRQRHWTSIESGSWGVACRAWRLQLGLTVCLEVTPASWFPHLHQSGSQSEGRRWWPVLREVLSKCIHHSCSSAWRELWQDNSSYKFNHAPGHENLGSFDQGLSKDFRWKVKVKRKRINAGLNVGNCLEQPFRRFGGLRPPDWFQSSARPP